MRTNPNPIMTDFNDYTPMNDLVQVTPSDSADLPNAPCRGIIFTGTTGQPAASGNVTFITPAGTQITMFVNSNVFGIQYFRATRILATGTTFNGAIFACY